MTPKQVIAASKGTIAFRKVKDPKGVEKEEVGGSYLAGGRTYDASFSFENGKLSLVSLQLKNANSCRYILPDLKSNYGSPIEETDGIIPQWIWDDRKNGNRINATGIMGDCLLQYQPLPSAKDSGL